MRKFFFFQLPVWAIALLITGMAVGMLAVFSLFREQVFQYVLAVPPAIEKGGIPLSYGEQKTLSDPDFFAKVKNDFISQRANFIEADLSAMNLALYEEGIMATTVPILTKGKEGSWWETPAGVYKIASKEKNHYSTFGHVYQPWSMSFQGNFFIHGWPYYPNGSPVASSYSGGCIRLSTPDAETIFGLAKVGMPVLVFTEELSSDGFQYQSRAPEISASEYLVADAKNNFVFLEKNKTQTIPFGHFSQFLAALTATDYINIEKNITLDEEHLSGVFGSRFVEGETTTPYDLLHPLLLDSDESVSRIFANTLSEKRFLQLANDKARAVGMRKTEFALDAPAVLSEEGNVVAHDPSYGATNAEDLFYLGKYLYHNRKFLFDISAGKRTNTIYEKSRFADIPNQNIFHENKKFVGGKAVKNSDGTESFFGVFEIAAKGERRPVFIFLYHTNDSGSETQNILNYVETSYQ